MLQNGLSSRQYYKGQIMKWLAGIIILIFVADIIDSWISTNTPVAINISITTQLVVDSVLLSEIAAF